MRRSAVAFVVLLAATEFAVRWSGLVDFPVYAKDDRYGYMPRPNQAGVFLGTNRWVFNDRGMGIDEPWTPTERIDIVVIGNSVVLGGNAYDQGDKLVPQIRRRLGPQCVAWPVATGGWNAVNEVRFLQSNPDIVDGSDFFVWEYMAQGMERPAPWSNETAFPTQRPVWATAHVIRKVLSERFPNTAPVEAHAKTDRDANGAAFEALITRLAKRGGQSTTGIIVFYPDRSELARARAGHEWLPDRSWVEGLASANRVRIIDLARDPRWIDSLYRDGVHPTSQGNAVIAAIIATATHEAMAPC